MYYKVPGTALIHELLDDEVILANLETGVYYSIRESGVPFWQLLLSGHNLTDVITLFAEKYHADLSDPLHNFVKQLLAEELLIETGSEQTCETPFTSDLCWPLEFVPPTLERYEEMKELLIIDPIHEVDEKGWPHKAIEQVSP